MDDEVTLKFMGNEYKVIKDNNKGKAYKITYENGGFKVTEIDEYKRFEL